MINDRLIDQAYSDLRATCGGIREDYFGLLYLEQEHEVSRERAQNQIAFGGNDYGVDGFHFDRDRRIFYIFQFKYSVAHSHFKGTLKRLIDAGMEQIFLNPNRDDNKNQILIQLRSSLNENRNLIDQVSFRFVFIGDPAEAERSQALDSLRERLEDKKFLLDRYFNPREVGLVVDFRSATGRVGAMSAPHHNSTFALSIENVVRVEGPPGKEMHVGLLKLSDLCGMHAELGTRFFDRNIRYGLGEGEAVNRALTKAFRQIILDKSADPRTFAFNHNGITLFAARFEADDNCFSVTAPRLLNGAQTVTTATKFVEANKKNPSFESNQGAFDSIKILCRIITDTDSDSRFVTNVTINNNRQNPVEPWNLRANDEIQLELQDKFRDELGIYYERQESAFNQLSTEDLEDYGIKEESKAIQMIKLTQTYLLTDGNVSRLSEIRRVFEDDKTYEHVFRSTRMKANSRHIVLCYKIQFRLRKLANLIEEVSSANKYWYVSRARYLIWALSCQGILNHRDLQKISEDYGTNMSIPVGYTEFLTQLATSRVLVLLKALLQDPEYRERVQEENLSFLRSDRAFDKCMEVAHGKWKWVHKKLT